MGKKEPRHFIVKSFINAYNKLDIEEMLRYCHKDIEFKSISNGEIELELKGIDSFRNQALMTKKYFEKREQKIESIVFEQDKVEVNIIFTSILAKDLPNGLKKGEQYNLNGISIFSFRNNKIISLIDRN